jgi:hypothetical protein
LQIDSNHFISVSPTVSLAWRPLPVVVQSLWSQWVVARVGWFRDGPFNTVGLRYASATGDASDAILDCKASAGSLIVPEDDAAVAHGDANLAIDDFLKNAFF